MLPTARLPDNLPTPTNSIVLFVMLGLFVFGLMAFAKFTQQRERKRRDLIRVIPRDWGNLGSRRTVWWRTQSQSNLSQQQNSLLTGKITGNFADSGLNPQFWSRVG